MPCPFCNVTHDSIPKECLKRAEGIELEGVIWYCSLNPQWVNQLLDPKKAWS